MSVETRNNKQETTIKTMRNFIQTVAGNILRTKLASMGVRDFDVSVQIEDVGMTTEPVQYRLAVTVLESRPDAGPLDLYVDGWSVRWESTPVASVLDLPDPSGLTGLLWDRLPASCYCVR